jgi:MarR family transcriptional regulator, organic hydroperoxide resistance regulator
VGPLTNLVITNIVTHMPGKLQAEIRQTKPFTSLEEECFLSLVRTTDALVRLEVEALKEWQLTPTQYNALRILRGAGEQGATCGEVGDRMLTRDPDVTRLIDRLESRGLIQRARSAEDRRVVRTRITRAGLDLLAKLDEPSRAWSRAQLGHMTKAELLDLIALLERARASAPG